MKFNVDYRIYSTMGDAQRGPMSEGQFRIEAVDEATAQQRAEHEIRHTDPCYDSRVDPRIDLSVEDASVDVSDTDVDRGEDAKPSEDYPEIPQWRVQVRAATNALVMSQLYHDDPGLTR